MRDEEYPDESDDDEASDTETCAECGAEVYEDAERCPKCGAWLNADSGDGEVDERALRVVLAIFIAFAAISAGIVWWLSP